VRVQAFWKDASAHIGAPTAGKWPSSCSGASYPSESCGLPSVHHILYFGASILGNWAVDLRGMSAGTTVRVYATTRTASGAKVIWAEVGVLGGRLVSGPRQACP
jgi:hypothetical protein